MPPDDPTLDAADARMLARVEERLDAGYVRAGKWFSCKPGCRDCCIGPFPIDALDARRLRRGLDALAARDRSRAQAVRERALHADAAMAGQAAGAGGPELPADEACREEVLRRFADLPCPALDPDTGLCDLYPARPMSCRTFGLPVRIGATSFPPCRHAFVGASEVDVERCRIEPDPDGWEDALCAERERRDGARGETLVAWALLDGREEQR